LKLITNIPESEHDLQDTIKLFYADIEFADNIRGTLSLYVKQDGNILYISCKYLNLKSTEENRTFYIYEIRDLLHFKRVMLRCIRITAYLCLKKHTKISMPWGSLTGVRPTKLGRDLLSSGSGFLMLDKHSFDKNDINLLRLDTPNNQTLSSLKEIMEEDFYVSHKKAELTVRIIKNQNKVLDDFLIKNYPVGNLIIKNNEKAIDFYINIPYCTSKCNYCSFVSSVISKTKQTVAPYTKALINEIRHAKELIISKGYKVRSVYIGGGTPTAIPDENLEEILKECNFGVSEFTVEAGRPDTITKSKLDLLKKYNVTRISINPQSFKDSTLLAIGRNHTSQDILNAYKMAQPYGFNINMDLIAGFSNEKFIDFKRTILKTLELAPDNITVHTLSAKRGSDLIEENGKMNINKDINKMLDYSLKVLIEHGYEPYYIYRQKYMTGNLENIGYSKKGKMCIFNIDSMEELFGIMACGANAISKCLFDGGQRIERSANLKDIKEYIDRIEEMKIRKENLFK